MWHEIGQILQEYMGCGLLWIWFLVSLVVLFFCEKRKSMRILFLYVPLLILCVFGNPLFAVCVEKVLGMEGYYRMLWLIPYSVVIAYTVLFVYGMLAGRKKDAFLAVVFVLILACGRYIYSSPLFVRAQNWYHVPQSVVEICDTIEVKGREVRALFPAELIQYVRQYKSVVFMPYGREMLVEVWGNEDPLYDLMESETIDAKALCTQARERACHYIVLPQDKALRGRLQDFAYELFALRDPYVIYKDATVTLTW